MSQAVRISCEHCGERRNVNGDYTSPANRERERREWRAEHESARCVSPT